MTTFSLRKITDDIAVRWRHAPEGAEWICFAIAFAALLNLGGMVTYLFAKASGFGTEHSVGGPLILLIRLRVGIGHAARSFHPILLLFRQQWRTSINDRRRP